MLRGALLIALAHIAAAQYTYVATTAPSGVTPTIQGVNSGHNGPDEVAWLRRMSVNSVRIFGAAGSMSTLQSFATSLGGTWGADLNRSPVTNLASFEAAVALLSTPAGHLDTTAWANPALLGPLAYNLNQSVATLPTGTSMTTHVARLRAAGIEPLVVTWLTCSNFAFSTLSQSNATYWAEHYELYKHQYIASQWAFLNGVRRIEFWNEPGKLFNTK